AAKRNPATGKRLIITSSLICHDNAYIFYQTHTSKVHYGQFCDLHVPLAVEQQKALQLGPLRLPSPQLGLAYALLDGALLQHVAALSALHHHCVALRCSLRG